ncbi:MAG: hypothetical protein RLZZ32_870 [Cyanobacteriota bacterium]|jgi:hypothetical protein
MDLDLSSPTDQLTGRRADQVIEMPTGQNLVKIPAGLQSSGLA